MYRDDRNQSCAEIKRKCYTEITEVAQRSQRKKELPFSIKGIIQKMDFYVYYIKISPVISVPPR